MANVIHAIINGCNYCITNYFVKIVIARLEMSCRDE